MATDSISGIGYPNMGLGSYGLGIGGTYGTYDNYMPSMMGMSGMGMLGMNSSILGGMGGYGGLGMMSMYNPVFMGQLQNQMEENQLQHAGAMHEILKQQEVSAHRTTDSALIQKILTNGDVQQGIQNLYAKVKSGDQDGICNEFDKLKNYVYATYKDELDARGAKINPSIAATQIVEAIYGQVITAQTGQTSDLRSDIERYGEGAMTNGFMQGFRGGHQKRYVDETMNHCFGLEINDKDEKDTEQSIGRGIGRVAHAGKIGLYGAGIGAATYAVGGGLLKGGSSLINKGNWVKFSSKAMGKFALVGALLGIAGDIWWQTTKA